MPSKFFRRPGNSQSRKKRSRSSREHATRRGRVGQIETLERREMMCADFIDCIGQAPDQEEMVVTSLPAQVQSSTDLGPTHGYSEFNDYVGGSNQRDDYHFTLDEAGEVTIGLDGLSADIDLYLYSSAGDELSRSWRAGSSSEQIEIDLQAGSYFARVTPWRAAASNYHLTLEVDGASDTRDLGVVNGVYDFNDWVGQADRDDSYQFQLADSAEVTLRLDGLSEDIDLYLYDANGNEMTRSWRSGAADEEISITLEAGVYSARVTPWSNFHSNYHFSLEVDSGNFFRELGVVSGAFDLSGWVGEQDANDFFRFELAESAELMLQLDGLSQDIDLYLYNAQGREITRSWRGGTSSEEIALALDAGVYVARVTPWNGAQSNYQLAFEIDDANYTRDLGVASGTTEFTGWVGQLDGDDRYRFELTGSADVALRLEGLSQDIDLYLYDSSGNEVARSWRGGSSDEAIELTLSAGTYYASVTPWWSYESDYRFSLSVSNDGGNPNPDPDPNPGDPFPDVPYFGGGNEWNLNAINAPEVWNQGYTGSGVIVAVIDTGVDYFHSDLEANMWTNGGEIAGNGIDDDGNGYVDDVRGWDFVNGDNDPMDLNGHGTHVSGTIAAENNGYGATGVAYNALIMPVQVLSASGSGTWAGVAAGIRYAVDNGADIINLSLGGGYSSAIESALAYASQNNVFVAAAAGNEYAGVPGFPAQHSSSLSNVLSVGAHTSSNFRSSFSNRVGGSGAVQVDAPGSGVYSTVPGEGYANYSGTSMASPHVAGLAALALSANPNLSASELRQLIAQGANRSIGDSDSIGGINGAMTVAMAAPQESSSFAPDPVPMPVSFAMQEMTFGVSATSSAVTGYQPPAASPTAERVAAAEQSNHSAWQDAISEFGSLATDESAPAESFNGLEQVAETEESRPQDEGALAIAFADLGATLGLLAG